MTSSVSSDGKTVRDGVFQSPICFHPNCNKPAPYGYGLPGLCSDKPEGKRGYLWACADHRQEAEERRKAAL